jgi:hypothetical protein
VPLSRDWQRRRCRQRHRCQYRQAAGAVFGPRGVSPSGIGSEDRGRAPWTITRVDSGSCGQRASRLPAALDLVEDNESSVLRLVHQIGGLFSCLERETWRLIKSGPELARARIGAVVSTLAPRKRRSWLGKGAQQLTADRVATDAPNEKGVLKFLVLLVGGVAILHKL